MKRQHRNRNRAGGMSDRSRHLLYEAAKHLVIVSAPKTSGEYELGIDRAKKMAGV